MDADVERLVERGAVDVVTRELKRYMVAQAADAWYVCLLRRGRSGIASASPNRR